MGKEHLGLGDIEFLLDEAYIPFGNEKRAIPWPTELTRLENDAEHSFSLSLIAGAVAQELGLDADKASAFGMVHDLVEIYAGDTSVWDDEGLESKHLRETAAASKLKQRFSRLPWIANTINEYEKLDSEEACLVYSLDKLLAVLMLIKGNGYFWKKNGITYKQHYQKYQVKRAQVAKHPVILEWYDEIHRQLETQKDQYFAK